MMGREKDIRQVRLIDVQPLIGAPVVPPDSFYGQLATWSRTLVTDDQFASLYEPGGRQSVPPARVAKMLLLMYHDNVSEREAEDRTRFDLRWKHALDLGLGEHVDRLALVRFRARLLLSKKAHHAFDQFLRTAVELGLLDPKALQVIDSTHVTGAAAVQDTYTLIRKAIAKLLRLVGGPLGLLPDWKRHLEHQDYHKDLRPRIDWNNEQARKDLLNALVKDAHYLLTATAELTLQDVAKEARELLAAVTEQDIETAGKDGVQIRKGVARDRVPSTVDPSMRHGRKSSAGRFTGHKLTVTVEPKSHIITNIKAHRGNSHDGSVAREAIAEQKDAGLKPKEVMGDTAYGGADLRHEMAADGVTIVAPAPGEPTRGRIPKSAFSIDLEKKECRCPAGQLARDFQTDGPDGEIIEFRFAEDVCQGCPFQTECLGKRDRGRRVKLHRHEMLLRQARAYQRTAEFKERYRTRPLVERANAELKRHGLRKARYIGLEKLEFQGVWTALALNMKRLFKRLRTEPEVRARLAAVSAG